MLDQNNYWTLEVDNNGKITIEDNEENELPGTNITASNIKPTPPTPQKWLKGASQDDFSQPTSSAPYILPQNDEIITYQIRVPITDINGYQQLQIIDEVDPSLSPVPGTFKAYLLGDPNTSISGSYGMVGRTMTFTKTADLVSLAGKTLVMEVQATVNSDLNRFVIQAGELE